MQSALREITISHDRGLRCAGSNTPGNTYFQTNTNGDIGVVCRGASRDYRIDAFSQAGEVFAPRGNLDAKRTLRAEGECGDVSIDFNGDV